MAGLGYYDALVGSCNVELESYKADLENCAKETARPSWRDNRVGETARLSWRDCEAELERL